MNQSKKTELQAELKAKLQAAAESLNLDFDYNLIQAILFLKIAGVDEETARRWNAKAGIFKESIFSNIWEVTTFLVEELEEKLYNHAHNCEYIRPVY